MYNQTTKNELLRKFSEGADSRFESLRKSLGVTEAMTNGDAAGVSKGISVLRDLMVSVIPEGLSVPKAFLYVSSMSSSGDKISMVNVTVSNKTGSEKNFRFTSSLVGDDVEVKAFNFLKSVYFSLIEDEIAQTNVDIANHVIAQAAETAGLGYSIKLVTALGNNGKKIINLTDDEVVFVADTDRLMGMENMVIFMAEDNVFVSEEDIQKTYDKLCDALAKAQTTVQLVGMHGGDLIALLCDMSKRVKPMTMISRVYNKNILTVSGDRDGIGFYNKDDVFAVVARKEGALELVLSPISTKTLESVEYNVIEKVLTA